MSKLVTIGEALSRRVLKKATTSSGTVPIYVPGQYSATRFSRDDVLLSYVDKDGFVNIVPCERNGDEWFHRGVVIQCSHTKAETRNIARSSPLWPEASDAIRKAITKQRPSKSRRAKAKASPPPPRGD